MYKPIIAIALLALVLSCTKKHQPTREESILGNWVEVKVFQVTAHPYTGRPFKYVKPGFTFYKDNTFENNLGYFRDDTVLNRQFYLGNLGKFKIKGDSLTLTSADGSYEDKYWLLTLNADTLKIEQDSVVTIFKHYEKKISKTPPFDKIILSSSGCYGTCPAINMMIDANGNVLFGGMMYTTHNGWYTGKITTALYNRLQDNFRQVDFDTLKTAYHAGWTDDQTICMTFVKDNKIYKSVLDYGCQAPCFFIWARTPLEYLYQTIKLSKAAKTGSIPEFTVLRKVNSKITDSIIRLMYSEQFLLTDYLHHGKKVTPAAFKPKFKLTDDFYTKTPINTDGRYYTFTLNGKQETIDLGFNFFDVNNKTLTWQKPDTYGD